jgi:hypothetical protein
MKLQKQPVFALPLLPIARNLAFFRDFCVCNMGYRRTIRRHESKSIGFLGTVTANCVEHFPPRRLFHAAFCILKWQAQAGAV